MGAIEIRIIYSGKVLKMSIEAVQQLIQEDFKQVNETILEALKSDVVLINEIGKYIVYSGGKRMRPMIALLCARAAGYKGNDHITAAALIEFIHTATLLHDDVVDHSDMRRGRDTANAIWGNEAAVLVGDFIYTRSFQMMVSLNSMPIMQILSNATNIIAEGEVMQLLNIGDPDTTEENYMNVIYSKTAKLFEASGSVAAIIAREAGEQDYEKALADYGMYLGTAFQLIDDILDYTASAEEMGKNTGDDLAEGKPTLPLIYAMRAGSNEDAALIKEALTNADISKLDAILAIIEKTKSIDYTHLVAVEQAKKAIEALAPLPDSPYKEALVTLAQYAVERTF